MTQDTKDLTPWALAVAREVRKMLAARDVPVIALDGLAGRNRMYWQRRIKKPTVALDINDLSVLAQRFDREITSFFPSKPESLDYNATVLDIRQGREKRTFRSSLTSPRNRRDSTRPRGRAA
jgi:hypothetical protein